MVSAKRGLDDIETEVALATRCEVSLVATVKLVGMLIG